MDFLMESGFMHWMSERMSFTNWVKADFHETSRITLKFSAPPRLRERYRLGAGSSRYGNCFFEGNTYLTLLSRWRFRWPGARSTRAALGAWRPSGAVDGRRGIGGRGRLFSVPRRGRRGYFARRARSDVQRRGDAGPS